MTRWRVDALFRPSMGRQMLSLDHIHPERPHYPARHQRLDVGIAVETYVHETVHARSQQTRCDTGKVAATFVLSACCASQASSSGLFLVDKQ